MSDRLAIALACLTGVMAIILFLVEKSPLTVVGVLVLMVALSIYPIFHFSKSNTVRGSLALCVIAVAVFLGWREWPNRHADAASQQQQPAVQQSIQGDGNANVNAPDNRGTITVITGSDPRVKPQLDRIENLLKAQQGSLTPEKLLAKYPLGYVIFDISYQNTVFPYQTKGELAQWDIDWSVVKYSEFTGADGDMVTIKAPNIRSATRENKFYFDGNSWTCRRKVGGLCGGGVLVANRNVGMLGEILSVSPKGTVFLFGFRRRGKAYS